MYAQVQHISRQIVDKLESQEVLSPLVSAVGTVAVAKRHHRLCRITKSGPLWFHTYSDATLIDFKMHTASPEFLAEQTEEYYLNRYTPISGDVVVDIGAGVGTELLKFSELVGDEGRVIAVEAHPRTFDALQRFCEINDLQNVEPVNCAVGEEEGTIYLEDLSQHVSNSVVAGREEGVEAPMTTIKSLLEKLSIDEVDFLKMNIEGAEWPALRVAGDILPRIHHACVACHDFKADATGNGFFRTREKVRELLESSGFDVSRRANHKLPWVSDHLDAVRREEQ